MTTEQLPPADDGRGFTEGLGPTPPERAAFEAAARARGLPLARDPDWHRFEGMTEEDRPYTAVAAMLLGGLGSTSSASLSGCALR